MSRRLLDGLIIATVLAGATHLWAQGIGGRKVVRPNQAGGAAVSGAAGSAPTSGSMQRSADGTVNGSRNTQAQAASGAAYDGSTTYDSATGVAHSGACTNAAGEVVACR